MWLDQEQLYGEPCICDTKKFRGPQASSLSTGALTTYAVLQFVEVDMMALAGCRGHRKQVVHVKLTEMGPHRWHVIPQDGLADKDLFVMVEEGCLQERALPKGELGRDGLGVRDFSPVQCIRS